VQGREVEVAAKMGASQPRPRSRERRRSSALVYVEVSTMAEIRAVYKASSASRSAEEAATSSGDSLDPRLTLRRSTRARKRTEKTRGSTSMKKRQYRKRVPVAEVASSGTDPTSTSPAIIIPSEPSTAQISAEQGNFRTFLHELHLDRIVPVFAEYGFTTAEDVNLIKEMTMTTRKQLFEWLIEDGKVNLKELAILHENMITKK